MILRPEDLIHKSYLNLILAEVIDNSYLSQNLAFKGGTCASMLGYLDRFSVDLDFDILNKGEKSQIRKEFVKIFGELNLDIIKDNKYLPFFLIKYANSQPGGRNSIKISTTDNVPNANEYNVQYLAEIDRLVNSQTIETMFANKLVAVTDRYNKYKTIAGRDIYDIHYFFLQGYKYKEEIIKERTGQKAKDYFLALIDFLNTHVNQAIINEDLNVLLEPKKFQQVRKILLSETIHFLTLEKSR